MLSIIIPTLNEEDYLPLLLESLKKQDFEDYEIIVADAGSSDKTLKIAKKYGCKVVKGGLPAVARNSGAKAARGKTILFLDADVVLPSSFLSRAMSEFKKKNVGIAGFPVLPLKGKVIDKVAYRLLNIFSFLTQKIIPYSALAILVTKDVHKKIGGFNEKIVFIEDYPYAKAASKVSRYMFMRSSPFYTSVRRFEKDGRFRVYGKYIVGQLHMIFIGPITSDIFKYKFSHYKEKKKNHV